jgi:hypothetical protein
MRLDYQLRIRVRLTAERFLMLPKHQSLQFTAPVSSNEAEDADITTGYYPVHRSIQILIKRID